MLSELFQLAESAFPHTFNTLTNSYGCGFPHAVTALFQRTMDVAFTVTAHLISSGWISICCHYCFTMHCMWFSTCCHCPLSKSNGFGFSCVVIAHILSLLSFKNQWLQFSLYCHYILSRQWMFFHMLSLLFHLEVEVIFHIFPTLHIVFLALTLDI